jgi:hypothetical protein
VRARALIGPRYRELPTALLGYLRPARHVSRAVAHTEHSGFPPDPYRWQGSWQPRHGPTYAGAQVGAGGFGLAGTLMAAIVRTHEKSASAPPPHGRETEALNA